MVRFNFNYSRCPSCEKRNKTKQKTIREQTFIAKYSEIPGIQLSSLVLTVRVIFRCHAGRNITNYSNLKRSRMSLQAKLPSSCHQRVFIPRRRGCSGLPLTHSVCWGRPKKVPGVMSIIRTTSSVSKPPSLLLTRTHFSQTS